MLETADPMLFTRCPQCRTTFRITAEALEKAGGHVRCGRCSSIFNAHDELREDLSDPPNAAPQESAAGLADGSAAHESTKPEPAAEADLAAAAAADGEDARADEAAAAPAATEEPAGQTARNAPAADRAESAADGMAAVPETADDEWVASVLEEVPEAQHSETPTWSQSAARSASGRRTALWSAASALALLALLGQGVHHFRGELATLPRVRPVLQSVYGYFGLPLVPHWDVHQYRILKWTATAEPKAANRDKGALLITAQIRNRGPLAEPYPYLHLRLKNRWEDVVGSRTFGPSEYLVDTPAPGALMAAGTTTQAKLAVVDPGPDAYGFDLDVCVKAAAAKFRCADDGVFK